MFTADKKGISLPKTTIPDLGKVSPDRVKNAAIRPAKLKDDNPVLSGVPSNSGIIDNMKEEKITVNKDLWANQPTSKIYNAKSIAENQILGINRVIKLKVIIEGKLFRHFKYFKLNQSVSQHHSFDLTLAAEEVGDDENHDMESAQNFLGKRLTVVFLYKDVVDGPERTFVGVITEVGYEQDQGGLGNIILSGFDPTVLLDAAPHTQSFGGAQAISLNSVADRIVKEGLGTSKYDFRVNCAYTTNIGYTSQYNETHFNYLARIAEAYGEQFFYDGEVLHFGQLPPQEHSVELEYGSNVSDIKVKMRAVHVNPTYYGYNSSKNEKLTTGKSDINHRSDIANRAYQISHETFTTPSLRVAPIKSLTYKDVDSSQRGTAGSNATQVFITTGNTSLPFLYPGCLADLKMRKKDSTKTSHFTKLMITEVTHEVDGRGYYNGIFQAIAADTGFLPRPNFAHPSAESQFAKVISNADPLNQGRVQVKFDWQTNDTTEWIRVMTPDAGGSDQVSTNRGFMSIPEVGDQVMVDFVHDNPDRPFVMGSMFHGKVGGGGGADNNVKSLSSKSGNKLELHDGEGSVFLTDNGGANMKFDGAGNAVVNVNTDHTTNAGQNHLVNVGSNHTTGVGGEEGAPPHSLLQMDASGNITLDGKTNITLRVGENSITITKDGISISSKAGMLDMNSSENALLVTQNSLSIHSKSIMSVNSAAAIYVSGKEVEIN